MNSVTTESTSILRPRNVETSRAVVPARATQGVIAPLAREVPIVIGRRDEHVRALGAVIFVVDQIDEVLRLRRRRGSGLRRGRRHDEVGSHVFRLRAQRLAVAPQAHFGSHMRESQKQSHEGRGNRDGLPGCYRCKANAAKAGISL